MRTYDLEAASSQVPAQVAFLSTPGVTVTPTRYGRVAGVKSKIAAKWLLGDFVCKDNTNAGYSFDNNTTGLSNVPCSAGESVGVVALGESGTNTSHTIDLVPAPSVQGGAMLTFFCTGGVASHMTVFMWPGSANSNCLQIASSIEQPVSFSGTISNLEVFYGTGPAAGLTDTFTVVKCHPVGTCVATAVTCQVTNPSQTCGDTTHAVAVSQGDGIQVQDATAMGSGAKEVRISIQIQ